MGVKGLWKYLCANNVKLKTVRLSDLARRAPVEPVLVCDLMGIFYWLIEQLYKAKVKSGEYSVYTAIYGGDFNDYRKRVEGFVDALRHIGIRPMFFMDGPTNGNPSKPSLRQHTAEGRYRKNLACIDVYAKVCSYDPKTEVRYEKKIKKVLLFAELVQTLKMKGVDVVTCHGQADTFMARYAYDNKDEVCGVLTNDTDLAFMSGCPMIHIKVFDYDNNLKLNTANMEVRPREITCKVLTPEILAKHFEIDEACLPALSILCGNDFTAYLSQKCGISNLFGHPVQKTATSFIQRNLVACRSSHGFLQIKEIEEILLEQVPTDIETYKNAVVCSYRFYRCCTLMVVPSDTDSSDEDSEDDDDITSDEDVVTSDDDDSAGAIAMVRRRQPSSISSSISKNELRLRRTRFDHFLLSLNCRNVTIWRNEVEQLDPHSLCIHEITQPIRMLMYCLKQAEDIEEYGQQSVCRFTKVTLLPDRCLDPSMLTNLQQMTDLEKLYCVFFAMCRNSIPTDRRIPDSDQCSININTVLICSSLMFARQERIIPDEYVMPLLLACFACTQSGTPPPTTSRPGPKGVTIAAQFMMILQHARWFASLIGINRLPLPSSAFQPYVYIPLHDVAFRITRKEKFRGEKAEALKSYYDSLAKEKAVIDLEKFIRCSHCLVCDDDVYSVFLQITAKFEAVNAGFYIGTSDKRKPKQHRKK